MALEVKEIVINALFTNSQQLQGIVPKNKYNTNETQLKNKDILELINKTIKANFDKIKASCVDECVENVIKILEFEQGY